MTDVKETTQATGGDVATNDTETKATKKAVANGKKWYKVLSGCIHGILHSAKFPFVQLEEAEAKAYGKEYVEQKGYATEKECPVDEGKED